MKNIAILGGGISGLSAAYAAKKAGHKVTLFEKTSRAGGLVESVDTPSGVIDLGPSSIRDTDGTVLNLVNELGLQDKVVVMDESGKTRYLVRDKKIHALKPNPISFLGSPVLSGKGKWRLLGEPFQKAIFDNAEESLYDFFSRRIGREAVEQLIDPVMSGIYAGDIRKMSAEAVFPKLVTWEKEHGSLLLGAIKSRPKKNPDEETEKPKSLVLNFHGGLGTLTEALKNHLSDSITYESVTKIIPSENSTTIETESGEHVFDRVISTLPSYVLSRILVADSTVLDTLKEIVYVPMYVMAIHTEREMNDELGGFGFLIPRNEGIRLLGSIHRSSIFPELCTGKGSVFTMFAGGRRDQAILDADEETLQNQLLNEFKNVTRYNGHIDILATKLWKKAIPQMEPSLTRAKKYITHFETQSSLTIGGNFRWGVSLPDCIRGAQKAIRDLG